MKLSLPWYTQVFAFHDQYYEYPAQADRFLFFCWQWTPTRHDLYPDLIDADINVGNILSIEVHLEESIHFEHFSE